MNRSQSKNKILVFIIFLLFITNILVIGYFLCFYKKPHRFKNKDGFAAILQKEVGFSQQQIKQFSGLKKTDWEQAKFKMGEIVSIKNRIFDYTKKPNTPDSVVEKLADSIALLQKQVEMSAYRHVVAMRKICTPEQQLAYDSLMKKIINKGDRYNRGNHPPPHATKKK